MTIKVAPDIHDRLHIDPNDDAIMRHWIKKTGKSKQQIEAAIAKVGNNAETVQRELNCTDIEWKPAS
jgi:hypothetical protein